MEFNGHTSVAVTAEYTCPMHPEIVRSEPGACPICGMALEPRRVTGEEVNPELVDMQRRFWISVALTVPVLSFMISEFIPGDPLLHALGMKLSQWVQFCARDSGCGVGRLALLRTCMALGTQPEA